MSRLDYRSRPNSRSMVSRALQSGWENLKEITGDFATLLGKITISWYRRNASERGDRNDREDEAQRETHQESSESKPRHLLLCISQWRGYYKIELAPIDLRIDSDAQLFRDLRDKYKRTVGPWRRFLSLRYLKDIRFVRVHTYLVHVLA